MAVSVLITATAHASEFALETEHQSKTTYIIQKVSKTGTTSLVKHFAKHPSLKFCYHLTNGYDPNLLFELGHLGKCECDTDVVISHSSRFPGFLEAVFGHCDLDAMNFVNIIPIRLRNPTNASDHTSERVDSDINYGVFTSALDLDPTKSIFENHHNYHFNPYECSAGECYVNDLHGAEVCYIDFIYWFDMPNENHANPFPRSFECETEICNHSIAAAHNIEEAHIALLRSTREECDREMISTTFDLKFKHRDDKGPAQYSPETGWSTTPWIRRHEKHLPLESYLEDYLNLSTDVPFRHVGMSYDYPGYFFDQREAGGTSMRASLHAAFTELGMTDVTIACFGGISCEQYTVNPKASGYSHSRRSRSTFYAMHSSWNTLWPLFQPAKLASPVRNVGKVNFTCFSVFREPISRVTSCIYSRLVGELSGKCINDLSVAEFTKILVAKKDMYGDGCLNEPFRIFSSLRMRKDDPRINHLGLVHVHGDSNSLQETVDTTKTAKATTVSPHISNHDIVSFRDSLEHLSNCVPLVNEIPESVRLLEYIAPQLYHRGGFNINSANLQQHYNSTVNSCAPPDKARYEVLYNVTRFETILYNTVVAKTKKLIAEKLV